MSIILRRIDLRRQALSLTDQAISVRATNTKDTIRNWRRKNSTSPTLTTLIAVAEVLGVTPGWLLGEGPEDLDFGEEVRAMRDQLFRIYDGSSKQKRRLLLDLAANLKDPEPSEEAAPAAPPKGLKQSRRT